MTSAETCWVCGGLGARAVELLVSLRLCSPRESHACTEVQLRVCPSCLEVGDAIAQALAKELAEGIRSQQESTGHT